ncbi:MAG TPA: FliH/SctL family protein [Edaphobacter sp.]|nr:FliH/SctL family protein [Edaphobacter sp.]
MMTLLSEDVGENDSPGERRVLPLEFEEIDHPYVGDANGVSMEECATEPHQAAGDTLGELEARLHAQKEQHARELEQMRVHTREEVREELGKERRAAILREREAVIRTCEGFAQERTRYFAAVEEEVVRLSLAVAARILHREIEMDPLLLKGAVRVALEKVQGAETAVLRVPEEQEGEWKTLLVEAHREDVSVVGDSRLQQGDCVLDTTVGHVDLGVKAQLEEIEKGFFDLLQKRPL